MFLYSVSVFMKILGLNNLWFPRTWSSSSISLISPYLSRPPLYLPLSVYPLPLTFCPPPPLSPSLYLLTIDGPSLLGKNLGKDRLPRPRASRKIVFVKENQSRQQDTEHSSFILDHKRSNWIEDTTPIIEEPRPSLRTCSRKLLSMHITAPI